MQTGVFDCQAEKDVLVLVITGSKSILVKHQPRLFLLARVSCFFRRLFNALRKFRKVVFSGNVGLSSSALSQRQLYAIPSSLTNTR
jgi:hypothetical protein